MLNIGGVAQRRARHGQRLLTTRAGELVIGSFAVAMDLVTPDLNLTDSRRHDADSWRAGVRADSELRRALGTYSGVLACARLVRERRRALGTSSGVLAGARLVRE